MSNTARYFSSSDNSYPLVHPEVFAGVKDLMEKAVENHVFPGANLVIGLNGREVFSESAGVRALKGDCGRHNQPVDEHMVYDIAAVSSVMVTTTILMKLVEAGKVSLQDRVSRYLTGFGVFKKSPITVEQVISHTAGFESWHPYFEELLNANEALRMGILTSRSAQDYVINSINRSQTKYEPGTRQVYSDVGLILMGHLVEILSGMPLEKAAFKYVFKPLGLEMTSFIDLTMIKRKAISPDLEMIAPTEECPWRRRMLCAEVHDDNAWAMGGIAGHSGLFSTARDMHIFASEMLAACYGESEFLSSDIVREFWGFDGAAGDTAWRLGWDSPSKENGMINTSLSEASVGLNGFTGCSLWIDPQLGLDIALTSNRIHPSRVNKKIQNFRVTLVEEVLNAVNNISG